MALQLITEPAEEPVSLVEAKAHLRLETAADDAQVEIARMAAREHAEKFCRRAFVTQTWELVLDGFPDCEVIELALGKLASVTSVKYIDADGAEQTLATTEYDVDTVNEPGNVRLGYGKSWPSTRNRWDAVRVRFVVGTGAASVPATVKWALLLLISHYYENRTPEIVGTIVSKLSFTAENLLRPYRLVRF